MAALVQHGGKLRYRTRSTARRIVVVASCVSVEKRFLRLRFLSLKVFSTMKVLNAFQAISKGLNLKVFQGSMLPHPLVASR